VVGNIKQTEIPSDLIGNRTRDFSACSSVSQPHTLLRAPCDMRTLPNLFNLVEKVNNNFMNFHATFKYKHKNIYFVYFQICQWLETTEHYSVILVLLPVHMGDIKS
jgi:hypothetical protein